MAACRSVAQPGRVLRSGRRGRGFEPRHSDPLFFCSRNRFLRVGTQPTRGFEPRHSDHNFIYRGLMSIIDDIIQFNSKFVEDKKYVPFLTEKFPKKKLAILTCMDTRLTELLPAALNIKNGDAKIIRNAGAVISHPNGSVMRSLIIAVYQLGVRDIMVIGHTGCGMEKLNLSDLADKMKQRNVSLDPTDCEWLHGFDNVSDSVMASVNAIKNHPLMPRDITVRGFVMNIDTGKINEVINSQRQTSN